MTDKELKHMLKNAYDLPSTDSGKRFVRKHEKRSLRIIEILITELRYMGIRSIPAGLLLFALLFVIARTDNIDVVWTISSFVPVCALIPMTFLSRSERFGMEELEAATRFSLRFVRIVRMFIMGIFSMILLLGIGIVLHITSGVSGMEHIIFVVFPYLTSAYGAMVVTRKWHGKENIFGVLAVCMFGGLLPSVIKTIKLSAQLPDGIFLLMIFLLLGAMFRECVLYVKESENLSWN